MLDMSRSSGSDKAGFSGAETLETKHGRLVFAEKVGWLNGGHWSLWETANLEKKTSKTEKPRKKGSKTDLELTFRADSSPAYIACF